MTKQKEKELKKYIEETLQETELKALQSVGSEGKYPYMVGVYTAAFKYILSLLSDK